MDSRFLGLVGSLSPSEQSLWFAHQNVQDPNTLPPCPLILDFTMTHDRYGRSNAYTNGMLTHRIRSTGAPQPDGALNTAAQVKNRHYKRLYAELHDPVVFLTVSDSTSDRINEETLRLLFLHANREASALAGEVPEESAQFHFIQEACLANFKGSLGLMLATAAAMRLTIPLDLSTKPLIPLPHFIHTRVSAPLLTPSLVLIPSSSV